MKEIFTDLYKKVLGFFQTQEKQEDHESGKDMACNRLKLVLMQDRTNLTPFLLERMRGEMIEVLSKYVEMDKEALELSFEQEGEQMALMLSIPVLRAKDEEEIQAILDEEAKCKLQSAKGKDEEELCTCGCQEGEECTCEECECAEEVEETDEDSDEVEDEEVCSGSCEDEGSEESSETPDEVKEVEEEASETKSKKKN